MKARLNAHAARLPKKTTPKAAATLGPGPTTSPISTEKSKSTTEENPGSVPAESVSNFEVLKSKARHNAVTYWFDNISDVVAHFASKLLPSATQAEPSRILVYPGKFDPFHLTHLQEVQGTLDQLDFDQAVVMPTPGQPGSQASNRAPAWLRMALIQTSIAGDDRIRTDHIGLRRDIRVAPELMASFREKVGPDVDLSMLMGADNFVGLAAWDGLDAFLADTNLVVNSRPGFDLGDWQASLSAKLGQEYVSDGPRRFVNVETKKSIQFVDVETGGFGSGAVVEAVKAGDEVALRKLMAPKAGALVLENFYSSTDYTEISHQYRTYEAARDCFVPAFGEELGPKLAQDSALLLALRNIPLETGDTTASIANAIYEAARGHADGLSAFPTLYSDAVKVALQKDLLERLTKSTFVKESPLLAATSKQAEPLGFLTNGLQWLRKKVKPIFSKMTEAAIRSRTSASDDEALPVRSAPLIEPFTKGETLRVYVGIKPTVDIEDIKTRGMLSKAERSLGKSAVDARIAKEGEASAIVTSMFGKDDVVAHISTSLSRSVAESYAPPGGHILVADIPACEGNLLNDPQIWSGTAFGDVGNPEHFLSEFVAREIKPEWIAKIEAAPKARGLAVVDRQSKYVRAYLSALLPLARNLVGI